MRSIQKEKEAKHFFRIFNTSIYAIIILFIFETDTHLAEQQRHLTVTLLKSIFSKCKIRSCLSHRKTCANPIYLGIGGT